MQQFTRDQQVEWIVTIPVDGSDIPVTYLAEGVVIEADNDSGWVDVRCLGDEATEVFGNHPFATRPLSDLHRAGEAGYGR